MKAIKRITALALCALMLLGLLSGCGEKKQGDEKFVLNVSVCNVIDSLDPAMNTDTDADSVFYALYENLMRESDDGSGEVTLTNGMAKEYTEETNYDGSVTYRFTLRSTARWSDGEKVTADDFVYAWQRLADPATDSPNHALMSVVAGYDDVRETGDKTKLQVSAKDESTFVVTLSAPCAYFIEGICTAVATMPLRRDLTENGGGFDTPDLVSNGAYHVSAWTKSSELTAARSDEYYEARLVGPDELHFIFTAGADEAWQLYEAGDIDYIAHLPNSVIAELSQDESWKPTAVYATTSVLYNNESDTFSNEHIRKAFDLAIDRAAATAAGGVVIGSGTKHPADIDTVYTAALNPMPLSDKTAGFDRVTNGTEKNRFPSVRDYGGFTDVQSGDWFYTYVRDAYRIGLANGTSATKFSPDGSFTVAQALTAAANIHVAYTGGSIDTAGAANWYDPYVNYCVANGIVKAGQFADYNKNITRGDMAVVFASILPAEAYTAVRDGACPDVTDAMPCAAAVQKLYRAGIVGGDAGTGNYRPSDEIARSEACVIFTRIAATEYRAK